MFGFAADDHDFIQACQEFDVASEDPIERVPPAAIGSGYFA